MLSSPPIFSEIGRDKRADENPTAFPPEIMGHSVRNRKYGDSLGCGAAPEGGSRAPAG